MKTRMSAAGLFLVLCAACGSNSEPSVNVNIPTTPDAVNSNGLVAAPGNATAQLPGNANLANSGDPGYAINSNRRTVPDVAENAPANTPSGFAAPENSVVSTTMDRGGTFIETRVFKDDSTIARIEKRTNGDERSARIVLSNGKAVDVPPDAIPRVNAITLAELRRLIGSPAKPERPDAAITDKPKH